MYLTHYKLEEKPFQITTDPKFLWMGEKHREALSTLTYGIMESKGFLLLTGEVGTGKTVLINRLSTMVEVETIIATIPDPDLDTLDFFNFLSDGLKMNRKFERKGDFLLELRDFLHHSHSENHKVLLIIDEAQRLNSELLEEIRLLSNIELHNRKLINIFFVGQDEFHGTLREHKNRAVAQRISVRYNIEPLTETETGDYIRHRLKIAGGRKQIFKSSAIHDIYSFSGGIPRLINIICDHGLLSGYAAGKKAIDARIIKECAQELRIPEYRSKQQDRLQETLESIRQEISENLGRKAVEETTRQHESEGEKTAEEIKETVSVEAEAEKPAEKRPFLVKAGYVLMALLMVAVGGYFFKNYQPDHSPQWKAEDLAPQKYKETLRRKEQSLKEELSGKKPIKRPPAVKKKTAALPDGNSVKQTKPLTEVRDPKGSLGSIKKLMLQEGRETDQSGIVEPGIKKASPPEKPVLKPPEKVVEKISFSSLRKLMTPPGHRIVIPFGRDSNEIPSDAFKVLDRVAEFMIQHPDTELAINGYTDTVGALKYNKRISEFRTNTIKSFLVGKGADPSKITTSGLGPENPVASNETAEGRKANRRVELVFDSKLPNKF